LKVPTILLSINVFGPSIDLSTCVSAAKLKIPIGLNFLRIELILFESLILHFLKI
jgi:hypothetical protein